MAHSNPSQCEEQQALSCERELSTMRVWTGLLFYPGSHSADDQLGPGDLFLALPRNCLLFFPGDFYSLSEFS